MSEACAFLIILKPISRKERIFLQKEKHSVCTQGKLIRKKIEKKVYFAREISSISERNPASSESRSVYTLQGAGRRGLSDRPLVARGKYIVDSDTRG